MLSGTGQAPHVHCCPSHMEQGATVFLDFISKNQTQNLVIVEITSTSFCDWTGVGRSLSTAKGAGRIWQNEISPNFEVTIFQKKKFTQTFKPL